MVSLSYWHFFLSKEQKSFCNLSEMLIFSPWQCWNQKSNIKFQIQQNVQCQQKHKTTRKSCPFMLTESHIPLQTLSDYCCHRRNASFSPPTSLWGWMLKEYVLIVYSNVCLSQLDLALITVAEEKPEDPQSFRMLLFYCMFLFHSMSFTTACCSRLQILFPCMLFTCLPLQVPFSGMLFFNSCCFHCMFLCTACCLP